jgi:hypothetical protein
MDRNGRFAYHNFLCTIITKMGIYSRNITQNKKTKAMKKFFAIAFIAATLVACNGGGEATPAADTTAALQVGDSYQGGKIAYIYQVGDPGYVEGQTHGIIAAPFDQSTKIEWWPKRLNWKDPPAIGAGGKALGTGVALTPIKSSLRMEKVIMQLNYVMT